jgi:hypothetical protein
MVRIRLRCVSSSVFVALVLGCVIVFSTATNAQSPMAIRNVAEDAGTRAAGIAANNPWFGAQIAHRFGTDGEFESNLLAAGQFVYEIPFKRPEGGTDVDPTDPTAPKPSDTTTTAKSNSFLENFRLPVVSNFGGKVGPESAKDPVDAQVKELLSTATGVTAGLFPYYPLAKNDNFMVTLHGLFAWRYNSLKPHETATTSGSATGAGADTSGTDLVALHQVKTGAGLEVVIGDNTDGSGGLTVSVTPVYTRFADKDAYKRAFGEERSGLGAIEVVGVIPVNKGVGVVIEGVAAQDGKRSFRAGLMLIAQPK